MANLGGCDPFVPPGTNAEFADLRLLKHASYPHADLVATAQGPIPALRGVDNGL